jgi:hypothetical protein
MFRQTAKPDAADGLHMNPGWAKISGLSERFDHEASVKAWKRSMQSKMAGRIRKADRRLISGDDL